MTLSVLLLLVEDDPTIIEVLETGLTDGGYEVVKVRNGTDAIKEIEAGAARFRAIVTDVKLGPGPDGWEVAARARELAPHMPIVYMSGDSTQDWASKGVPGSVILAKPFAPAQLVTAVSALVTDADLRAATAPEAGGDT